MSGTTGLSATTLSIDSAASSPRASPEPAETVSPRHHLHVLEGAAVVTTPAGTTRQTVVTMQPGLTLEPHIIASRSPLLNHSLSGRTFHGSNSGSPAGASSAAAATGGGGGAGAGGLRIPPPLAIQRFPSGIDESHRRAALRDQPSEVIPGFLYLGSAKAASNSHEMARLGIDCFLCCAAEANFPQHALNGIADGSILCLKLQMADGVRTKLLSHYTEAFQFLRKVQKLKRKVFVYCREGKSRSASIIIAFLIRYLGMTYEEALRTVRFCRSLIDPNVAFCSQLSTFEEKLEEARAQQRIASQATGPESDAGSSSGGGSGASSAPSGASGGAAPATRYNNGDPLSAGRDFGSVQCSPTPSERTLNSSCTTSTTHHSSAVSPREGAGMFTPGGGASTATAQRTSPGVERPKILRNGASFDGLRDLLAASPMLEPSPSATCLREQLLAQIPSLVVDPDDPDRSGGTPTHLSGFGPSTQSLQSLNNSAQLPLGGTVSSLGGTQTLNQSGQFGGAGEGLAGWGSVTAAESPHNRWAVSNSRGRKNSLEGAFVLPGTLGIPVNSIPDSALSPNAQPPMSAMSLHLALPFVRRLSESEVFQDNEEDDEPDEADLLETLNATAPTTPRDSNEPPS